MAKRAINWTEIKERWQLDEPPRVIAPEYKNLTAEMITKKAYKENWKAEKSIKKDKISAQIQNRVVENVLLTRERLYEELCHMAYTDYKDYATVHKGGGVELKAFEDMPENATRAIKKIKEKRKIIEMSKEGAPTEEILVESQLEYELHPKLDSIKALMQALGFDAPAVEDPKNKLKSRVVVEFKRPEKRQ